VGIIDRRGVVTYVSPSIQDLLGWTPEDVLDRYATDFARLDPSDIGDPMTILGSRRTNRIDVSFRHADGSWRDFEAVTTDYLDDPAIGGFVVNARDVTERRQADQRLRHANLHDPLTGLPNRTRLIDCVDDALREGDPRRMA